MGRKRNLLLVKAAEHDVSIALQCLGRMHASDMVHSVGTPALGFEGGKSSMSVCASLPDIRACFSLLNDLNYVLANSTSVRLMSACSPDP
eukprot:1820433-Pleurochrysis_carterae.AAC.1